MTTMSRLSLISLLLLLASCQSGGAESSAPESARAPAAPSPPAKDDLPPLDPTNIVSIAAGSKDHSTLVAALKAADYVGAIANPGPLTVFAPTNAAFEKLPAGTVETLLKPEKQQDLKEVLKYHATTSVYQVTDLKDGQLLSMANGAKAKIQITDGKMKINDANVLASVRASNGIVHVIDAVLLPPTN